jgi:hypothetical protein
MSQQDNYTILKDIWDKLDSMDKKMDDRFERMESRVIVLEGFKTQALTLFAVCTSIAAFTGALVKDQVIGFFLGKKT